MLVTPLKVFTSVHSISNSFSNSQSHRLIIEKKEYNNSSIKVEFVSDSHKALTTNEYTFNDCQYVKEGQKKVYLDQIEYLVDTAFQGYNSAGVFINAEEADMDEQYSDFSKSLINAIDKTWKIKNQQREIDGLSPIKMEGGVFGFIDEYCFNYINNQQMKDDYMTGNDLVPYLQPMSNTNELYHCIKTISRGLPSVIFLYLTDNKSFYSRLAWIDFPSPFTKNSPYNQSFLALHNFIQIHLNKSHEGIINAKTYSMQRVLMDCFLGHYNTMVFSHYNEYTTNDNLDLIMHLLRFTSDLKKIKCKVIPNQQPKIHKYNEVYNVYKHQINKDLDEIQKQLDFYQKSFLNLSKEIEEQEKRDYTLTLDIDILKYKNELNRERMQREKLMKKWELAKFRNEIRKYNIALVQASVARESYSFTQQDLETLLDMENETISNLQQENEYNQSLATKLENELTEFSRELASKRSMIEEQTRNYEYSMEQVLREYSVKEADYISTLTTYQQVIKDLENDILALRRG